MLWKIYRFDEENKCKVVQCFPQQKVKLKTCKLDQDKHHKGIDQNFFYIDEFY